MQNDIENTIFGIIIFGLVCIFILPLIRELRSLTIQDIKDSPEGIKIFIIVSIVIFLLIFPILHHFTNSKENYAFIKKSALINAKVYAVYCIIHRNPKTDQIIYKSIDLKYTYKVGDSTFVNNHEISVDYKYAGEFNYKTYPLFYDTLHPNDSRLIVTQADYDNFGILSHDSMLWAKEYEQKE